MATRRQEKVARVIKEAVSDAVANHLNDPRIEGFVSVMGVEVAADLRTAEVYLSIFGTGSVLQKKGKPVNDKDDSVENKTFAAIMHARSRIQSLLSARLQSKFCPVLHFHKDDKLKKTLETMKLINQAVGELEKKKPLEEESG